MSDMKTVETDIDPHAWLATVEPVVRRDDAATVLGWMEEIAGLPPRMWGDSIIGFGHYDYARRDGSRHSFFRTGLAPRKSALTIYLMPGVKRYATELERLGPHKSSVSCLYVTRLARIDPGVLRAVIGASWEDMATLYPD